MENPFNPSFGKTPSIFLNRDDLTKRIVTEFNKSNSPFQTSLIYGQRGSGKTTLMTEVSNLLIKDKKWIVINLVLDDDLLTSLINQLKKHLLQLKIVKNIDVELKVLGLSVSTSFNQAENEDFQLILQDLLERLTKKGYNVLINIDEVHLTPLLKKFASCYQIMIRQNLNVSLLMAGLPENVSEIQNDDVLTFLLRANRIVLNPLNIESIKNSYKHIFTNAGFTIDDKTILFMTKQTLGFAYAFQLLGYHVWEEVVKKKLTIITTDTVKNVLDTYKSELNRNVYFKIYTDLSQKEKEFVQAMVKTNSQKVRSKSIGEIMHKGANYIAVYRAKLIDNQVIKANGYGYVSFLLPYFDKFVQQQMILNEF